MPAAPFHQENLARFCLGFLGCTMCSTRCRFGSVAFYKGFHGNSIRVNPLLRSSSKHVCIVGSISLSRRG